MTEYLVFTLAAPLASFGTVAVGERRPTWDRPSKSQTIGLVAACLGIERAEEERQRALAAGLGFAVRIDDPGILANDYHTAQAPKEVEIKRWVKKNGAVRTRADELACDDLKTILSQREFRVGSRCTIALWRTEAAGELVPSLEEIAKALKEPAFVPYAGRKAHPLMLPMGPAIVPAPRIEDAFTAFDAKRREKRKDGERESALSVWGFEAPFREKAPAYQPIFTDLSALPTDRLEREKRVSRLEERRDIPESRAKWQFGLRTEAVLKEPTTTVSAPGGGR